MVVKNSGGINYKKNNRVSKIENSQEKVFEN